MTYSDREQRAIEFTIGKRGGSGNEGGFSDRADDKGGATFSGFTLATVRQLSAQIHGFTWDADGDGEITAEDLKHLTYDELEAMADTYYPKRLDMFEDPHDVTAIKTYDLGFNCGQASGIRLLQTAVNRCLHKCALIMDGQLGPQTVAVINSCDGDVLLQNLIQVAKEHYIAITKADASQQSNLNGWLNRAARLPQ